MPDPKTICTVKANGQIYRAWKSVSIRHDYGDMIPYFQLECSETGPFGGANDSRRLVPQTPVEIYLGGELVLTGAVEIRSASYDAGSHVVLIGGRSATAGAVPSAMPITAGNYNGNTLEQAARAALQPHGVNLKVVNPPPSFAKVFPYLSVNPGEWVGEFIERTAKMRGCFVWGDAQGNLCIGQGDPKAAPVAYLVEGRNILRATWKLDDQGIFSPISYRGQQPGIGDDYSDRTAQGSVTDPSLKTTRIRNEHAEMQGDADDMTMRASIEAARSGWDRVEATVTVAGWFCPSGRLWGITNNVSVYSPMGLPNGTGSMPSDNPLGIQAVTYSQTFGDEGEGTTTTLTLVRASLLSTTPNAGVQSDGKGGYLEGPPPGQPDPPDYSQGSAGPGGLLGHV